MWLCVCVCVFLFDDGLHLCPDGLHLCPDGLHLRLFLFCCHISGGLFVAVAFLSNSGFFLLNLDCGDV
jgi:hypothetical protein